MSEENTKHDDLDNVEIDQLHNAILQMSKSCFEYKKICVGILGAAIALIAKFNPEGEPIADSLLITSLIIVISFWIADSTAYYFQVSTRVRMNSIRKEIAVRNNISDYKVKELKLSILNALLNGSMVLYYILILFFTISWYVYGG